MPSNVTPVPGTGKPVYAPHLWQRCLKASQGSITAAALLLRVHYWMPKASIKHGGHTWIAKSIAEWCGEAGLTPKQYRVALARLKQARVLETEQHLFRGKNITHLRLTAHGRAMLALEDIPGEAPQGSLEKAQKGAPITQGDTNKEKPQGESGVLPHADCFPSLPQGIGAEKPKLTTELGSTENPEAGYPVKDDSNQSHKPGEHLSLADLWQQTLAEVEGKFVPALTVKQKGQLKHFAAKCPEGKAAQVLEFCLRKWPLFTSQAKSDAGLFKAPASPDVGFLLKHVGSAVNLYLEEASKPKFALPPQSIVPKKPLTGPEDEKPASAEDVLKILKG